jgi:hypothetical protein
MAGIDLQIVREFFELNQFKVSTRWPQHDPQSGGEGGVQLYVQNAGAPDGTDAETELHPSRIHAIGNAVVEIRPWHTDRFYASLIDGNPVLTQFAEPWSLSHAEEFFGGEPFTTILVISELPRTTDQRSQALRRIEETGVKHVLEFPAILQDLGERVALAGTYNGSPTLELLQLLKRYRLLRSQQLEFTFPRESVRYSRDPRVETTPPADDPDA